MCDKCNGTGYIFFIDEDGYERAAECGCRIAENAMKRLERSGLAKLFRSKSFDNFQTQNIPVLEKAKDKSTKYVENYLSGNRSSILLLGQVGSGKTHLGAAITTTLINESVDVVYMGYREDMTTLKAIITDNLQYSEKITRFKETDVLFIDDFIKGKTTESDKNIMYEIINYRYVNELPIIMTCEYGIQDIIGWDDAVGTRLLEMSKGTIIELQGANLNYRISSLINHYIEMED